MSSKISAHIKILIAILVASSFVAKPAIANPDLIEPNAAQMVIKAPLAPGKEAVITVTEQQETTPEQIQDLLRNSQTQKSDIIVSTDQESVVEAVLQATSSPSDKRLLRFIPIGKLAHASEKIASSFKAYYARAKNTLLNDRIGLTVLTITVGYDTLIWINSASFNLQQKSSMTIMNLIMAATFGLDRDLWSAIKSPIKTKLISVFDTFLMKQRLTKFKSLTGQFLSGIALGIGVQVIRTGLLSLDHISDALSTSDFWLTAAKISGLITLTSFGWTEMFSSIDAEKKPIAKMMMKRIGEMRGLILGQLASISMVLQPEVYGHIPVITFLIHGSLGLLVIANADQIINFLETNATVNRIYRKVQTFENFINKSFRFKSSQTSGAGTMSCKSLFL
ncbi:MAG: hypothetical protein AABY53_00980 [Bdellovibrionota bacterium]